VPVGVPGELCVAGGGLARGYRGGPAATAEWFVPNPVDGRPGERLYRTGDLARRLAGGGIEFLGRIDQQVKIRGVRIELGEIESALAALPGVAAAAVVAREDSPGSRRLAAYVVAADSPLDGAELRARLATLLPEAMLPSAWVFLEALPLTANGKVDRRALPAPEPGDAGGRAFIAPRTPLEEQVAGIWREVLGVERVGLSDGFWDLGGHSLLAARVLARVHEAFGVELALTALFMAPRLEEFAAAVGAGVLAEGDVEGFMAELDGLSEEEIRELLAEEQAFEEFT
jgi:acyl carrier protein